MTGDAASPVQNKEEIIIAKPIPTQNNCQQGWPFFFVCYRGVHFDCCKNNIGEVLLVLFPVISLNTQAPEIFA